MTRKSRSSLSHAAFIGRYLHKQTHWEMRRPLTTSLDSEGTTSLPLDELAFWGVVIILCAIWRRKKSSCPTHCRRVKLYNQTSASKPYMARQKVLLFKKISEDIIRVIQSMSGYIFKAECFNGSRQVNISWFHLLLSGDVELNPGPYTGEDAGVKEKLLTICDKLLTIKDWDAVVSAVGPLTALWYDLGRKLGIRHDTLAIIAKDKDTTCLCLNETIAQWLQLNYITDKYSHPSWRSLAEAVVDLNKSLFLKIASDHEAKDEESITIKNEQPNLSNQAMSSAETVKPKPLLHENTDVHSKVKTSAEEVKSKLFTEDNTNSDAISVHSTVKEQSFPNLKTENLTTEQSEELIAELTVESEDMRSKFATLVSIMNKSLQKNKVSVSELTVTFINLDLDELVEILEDVTDMNKAILKASDFWSFFDYEIVKCIINTHCRDDADLQQEVKSYESDFKIYCEKRLCEVPVDSFNASIPSKTSNLHLKIDETFKIKLCKIKKIEAKLSNLLGKRLYLLKVEDGCIELVFSYLGKIKLTLPLNSQQEEELSKMRVLRLYDDNCEYYPAPTLVRSPSPSSQQSQLPSTKELSSKPTTGDSDVPPSKMPKLLPPLKSRSYSVKAESAVSDSYKVSLDLKTVRNALWVARNHWYSIGIGLNFEPSTLDAIRYRYHGADRCLIEVILEWLSCAVPQPSWGALVEALESNSVNYPDLAAKIRREYMKQE